MKRIFIALSLLCVPLLVFSENKIKMVTYFPVPYVAYSKINASKQLDIGLTSACEMNLGCSESGALGIRPLQATTVNLNRGKLDLNTAAAVKSTNVTLGSGSGEANIDFSTNLRIGTLNNGYSLEAADMTVDELKLFASHMKSGGEKFPSCAATGASGAPQVSWQKVKLKKAEEVYLVCGTPEESVCQDKGVKKLGDASLNVLNSNFSKDITCPAGPLGAGKPFPFGPNCSYFKNLGASFPCTYVSYSGISSSLPQEHVRGGSVKLATSLEDDCPDRNRNGKFSCHKSSYENNVSCRDVYKDTSRYSRECYSKTFEEALNSSLPRCRNKFGANSSSSTWYDCWDTDYPDYSCKVYSATTNTGSSGNYSMFKYNNYTYMERYIDCIGVQKYSINCCS